MRVAVEEPVAEDHRHPRVGHPVRELAALLGRPVRQRRGRGCASPRGTRASARGPSCSATRRAARRHAVVAGEVAAERLRVPRLLLVVELLPDRAGELVDERLRVDEVERRTRSRASRAAERSSCRSDSIWRGAVRPLHLDDDVLAVREASPGAPARSRRPRSASRRTSRNARSIVRPSSSSTTCATSLERDRRDVVLELAELDDDVRRHQVGARREQLAELDERRPELVEHLAQPPPAVGDGLRPSGVRRRSNT